LILAAQAAGTAGGRLLPFAKDHGLTFGQTMAAGANRGILNAGRLEIRPGNVLTKWFGAL